MSQLDYLWDTPQAIEQPTVAAKPWFEPSQRPLIQPILLVLPAICAAGGYVGETPFLVDMAFLFLAILCSIFLIGDLLCFSERWGLGGVVLYGGVLVWFCYDYFFHWFFKWLPHWNGPLPANVVAKSATCHMLYILCMSIGIRIRKVEWFPKLLASFPDTRVPSHYFWIVILTQIIGLSPYFIFTNEPFYMAFYHQFTVGRGSLGPAWTVGRTGNLNYNWGAYVAQILQIGNGGAVVASMCVVLLRQGVGRNVICALIWLLWLALGFGTGTRTEIAILLLPLVCFLFIRYHVQAQEMLHRYSVRAYIVVAIAILFAIALVQVQIRYRNVGFHAVNLEDVSFVNLEGNSMFSEGLIGFSFIPEHHDFFYNSVPGESILLPIPNFLFWAAVAPMPRALWQSKPVDPSWAWYNDVFQGGTGENGGKTEGTTISQGIVGYWFFRFGIPGVIEGGIFMGWLLGCAERIIFNNRGRPYTLLVGLGLLSWIFRAFRDIGLQDLTSTMVSLAGIMICIFAIWPFTGQAEQPTAD